MATTLYLYESLQRLLEYAELDANFKNLRTTADGAATKAGTVLTSGVTLGNTAQAGATVLDWYEEGTFTPTLYGLTTAGVGTYLIRTGRFTRIGNRAFVDATIVCTGHTGTGSMQLSGWPFIASGSQICVLSVRWETTTIGAGRQLCASMAPGSADVVLRACDPAGGGASPIAMDATTTLYISGCYFI